MLKKCIYQNGIENKQTVKIEIYKGTKIYMLTEDHHNPWGCKHIEFDGYLLPISRDTDCVHNVIYKYPGINEMRKYLTKVFDQSLKGDYPVSLGLAEYFGRGEEAIRATQLQQDREAGAL